MPKRCRRFALPPHSIICGRVTYDFKIKIPAGLMSHRVFTFVRSGILTPIVFGNLVSIGVAARRTRHLLGIMES